MSSDMEAIFEMVENESAIQDTMDAAALILSSGEYMDDKQERRIAVSSAPQDPYVEQLEAIRTETSRTREERAAHARVRLITELSALATDCNFELTVDLEKLTKMQLNKIKAALLDLQREQSIPS